MLVSSGLACCGRWLSYLLSYREFNGKAKQAAHAGTKLCHCRGFYRHAENWTHHLGAQSPAAPMAQPAAGPSEMRSAWWPWRARGGAMGLPPHAASVAPTSAASMTAGRAAFAGLAPHALSAAAAAAAAAASAERAWAAAACAASTGGGAGADGAPEIVPS